MRAKMRIRTNLIRMGLIHWTRTSMSLNLTFHHHRMYNHSIAHVHNLQHAPQCTLWRTHHQTLQHAHRHAHRHALHRFQPGSLITLIRVQKLVALKSLAVQSANDKRQSNGIMNMKIFKIVVIYRSVSESKNVCIIYGFCDLFYYIITAVRNLGRSIIVNI